MPNTPVTWLDELTVNTTTANSQFNSNITQLANGNILVSWTSTDNTGVGSMPARHHRATLRPAGQPHRRRV